MSAHPSVIRTTLRSRPRTVIGVGAIVLVVAAGLSMGLARSAAADTPAYDPHDAITPVASYTFDTAAGATVADGSGSGNNATWKGTPSYVKGVSGTAIAVSSGTNYVKLPLVAGKTDASSSFSFEFWMNETARTSYGTLVSNQDFDSCNNKGITLYNQSTAGVLESCWGQTASGTKEYVHGISSTLLNAWHHVGVVVDRSANVAKFYIDGVEKATSPAGAITASTAFASGLAFNIGGLSGTEADAGDGYTNASVDDFNFFAAAIPASQVAADYVASQPASAAYDYTVAYQGNGSDGGATAAQTMTSGTSAALRSNGFTRQGYRFAGWATTAGGSVVYTDGQTVSTLTATPDATVTLYAVWNRLRALGDTDAPVLSYDFDADSGLTVNDNSGNGNPGTWSGSSAYAAGVSGTAAYVNSPAGSTKGINFFSLPLIGGKTDASSSFSYVFWLKESSSSSDSPIVSNQNFVHCYNRGSSLYNTDPGGILRACFGQNGSSTTQNYLPSVSSGTVIGAWHQVAVVADRTAGTMTTYLDGQQTVMSAALSSGFSLASGFPFRVGAEGSGTDTVDGFINALVDDFDFYSVPVSAAQIKNDYNATKPSLAPTQSGSTVTAGFVTDTFRAPQVRTGAAVTQSIAGLWNGHPVTSYSKVAGSDWLSVAADGRITGTAPAQSSTDPASITVRATDGTTTSQLQVELTVVGQADSPQLATATWNLWDAGSHVSDSTLKDLAVIASNGLNLIGLQQDGGTLATTLANALGWSAVEGSGGVGIVSAYPLDPATTSAAGATVPAVGVTVHLPGRSVRVWSAGLDRAGYGPEAACIAGVTDPAALVAAEKASTRYEQARAVASAIAKETDSAARTPVVLLGDLESPSPKDWTAATAGSHCGVGAVDWPVAQQFASAGLTDSFRAANVDPKAAAGATWSPMVTTDATSGKAEPQDRIDYVDYAGSALTVLGSNTLVAGFPSSKNLPNGAWTSNHRAVVTTFRVTPMAPPTLTAKSSVAYQVGSAPTPAKQLADTAAASSTAEADIQLDSSAVDLGAVGTYSETLTATDPESGLTATPVTVTVHVVPVVTLSLTHPSVTEHLAAGEKVTAADLDAGLGPVLNVPGTVGYDLSPLTPAKAGSYTVTVTGTDEYGFTATADATVVVTIAAAPAGSGDPVQTAPHPGLAWTGTDVVLPFAIALTLLLLGLVVVLLRRARARRD